MADTLAAPFSLITGSRDGTATVSVQGCLDASTAPLLSESLSRIMASVPGRVVVDLAGLTSIDTAGAAVFRRVARSPLGHLVPLVLRHVDQAARLVLCACDLDELLVDRSEEDLT